jgi:hypothetical protein
MSHVDSITLKQLPATPELIAWECLIEADGDHDHACTLAFSYVCGARLRATIAAIGSALLADARRVMRIKSTAARDVADDDEQDLIEMQQDAEELARKIARVVGGYPGTTAVTALALVLQQVARGEAS